MTETEWLTCTNAQAMLDGLRGKASQRKFRLFACACGRRLWDRLPEKRSRQVLLTAERFADGLATRKELGAARASAPGRGLGRLAEWSAKIAVCAANESAAYAAVQAAATLYCALQTSRVTEVKSMNETVLLIRHLFGNPFRPPIETSLFPSVVAQLAEALYHGGDCAYALHDALLEAGHGDLAEHFRESEHPKGCWAVDGILGKK